MAYISTIRKAFQSITRRPLPNNIRVLPEALAMLYHLLVVEAVVPVRIVLGYHGFKGEAQMRAGFARRLTSLVGKKGSGPMSLPNVVLNRRAAVIKANGMPWVGPLENGWWSLLVTAGQRSPAAIFLEAIFSRLHNRRSIDHRIFGEDLELEAWNRFLDVKFDEAKHGWEYRLAPTRVPKMAPDETSRAWTPVFLTLSQFVLMNLLCGKGEANLEELARDSEDLKELEADATYLVWCPKYILTISPVFA